ncbi:MAG: RNA polymerase Rpb4 family protein [Methanomicrobiales archaeon]|nr:RNA polymerase Rpb4 family protein [Methanomicrobiales archaeon]MDD1670494.1 RNA polymerase Rpb4 family protein [Methanomicrobiales archaeon]
MRVKAVLGEERITLAELKEILTQVEESRREDATEMAYELRRSIEHATHLAKSAPDQAKDLVAALLALEKMKPDIAYRIANIMPRTRDELRAIYAKERFTLTGEELDQILSLVSKHL